MRGGRPELVIAAAAAALAAAASCSLILDFGGDLTDAGPGGEDAGGDGGLGAACETFEPNDTREAPAELEPGTYPDVAICPAGDRDFYAFSVDGSQDVLVVITFDNRAGQGDLELRMFDEAGMMIDSSSGFDDDEQIERSEARGTRLAAGSYTVEVFGFNANIENAYSLSLEITGASPVDAGVDAR